jgi:prophage regulatory protein
LAHLEAYPIFHTPSTAPVVDDEFKRHVRNNFFAYGGRRAFLRFMDMKTQYQSMDVAKVIRLPEVIKYTGMRRSSIYAAMSDAAKFPRPIRLGKRSVGWLEHEISAWIESRVALRDEVSHV